MDVPLSRFLTRFSVDEPFVAEEPVAGDLAAPLDIETMAEMEPEPEAVPVINEIEVRLNEIRHEIEAQYIQQVEAIKASHDVMLAESVNAARMHWCETEAKTISDRLDAAVPELRAYLADKINDALMPLLAQAVIERTREALLESIGLVLADRDRPVLTVRGPGDLLDAIRAAHPETIGIEYVPHDDLDAIVTGDGLRIETRLEDALTALTQQEI